MPRLSPEDERGHNPRNFLLFIGLSALHAGLAWASCGRPRAYYRKFGMCRICFRNLAAEGRIPGVTKSSW